MREKNWTPKPWTADDGNGYSLWTIHAEKRDTTDHLVAHVIGDSGETDANARLIAAAPELAQNLYSMISLVKEFMEGEVCDHAVGICFCGVHADLADAEAALAKAHGDSDVR